MPRAVIDNMNNGGGAMRIDLLQCACCRCYPDDATILTLAIRALSVDTMSAQYLGPTIDPLSAPAQGIAAACHALHGEAGVAASSHLQRVQPAQLIVRASDIPLSCHVRPCRATRSLPPSSNCPGA